MIDWLVDLAEKWLSCITLEFKLTQANNKFFQFLTNNFFSGLIDCHNYKTFPLEQGSFLKCNIRNDSGLYANVTHGWKIQMPYVVYFKESGCDIRAQESSISPMPVKFMAYYR